MTLRQNGKEETRVIDEITFQGDAVLLRFAGIKTPEAAKTLSGAEIIVEREFAAPLKKDEFYIEDLKGLKVIDKNEKALGQIVSVVEAGGGFLAEIKLLSGEKKFAPFRKEFFGSPDQKAGKIELLESWVLES